MALERLGEATDFARVQEWRRASAEEHDGQLRLMESLLSLTEELGGLAPAIEKFEEQMANKPRYDVVYHGPRTDSLTAFLKRCYSAALEDPNNRLKDGRSVEVSTLLAYAEEVEFGDMPELVRTLPEEDVDHFEVGDFTNPEWQQRLEELSAPEIVTGLHELCHSPLIDQRWGQSASKRVTT